MLTLFSMLLESWRVLQSDSRPRLWPDIYQIFSELYQSQMKYIKFPAERFEFCLVLIRWTLSQHWFFFQIFVEEIRSTSVHLTWNNHLNVTDIIPLQLHTSKIPDKSTTSVKPNFTQREPEGQQEPQTNIGKQLFIRDESWLFDVCKGSYPWKTPNRAHSIHVALFSLCKHS